MLSSPHASSTTGNASAGRVTARERAERIGHGGCIIWLTGLSGAGKSTIATSLERALFDMGKNVCVLDGDELRSGLCADLGFSPEDRHENLRRASEVAILRKDLAYFVIMAFISPYRADRDRVRSKVGAGEFIEVFVNAPLDVCEQRDPKGLYVKARSGAIADFTGVSAPYEPPLRPEIELRTHIHSPEECVGQLLQYLRTQKNDYSI